MPSDNDDVSFHLEPSFGLYRGRRWFVVRLHVGLDIVWDMLPNPLAGRSGITPLALADLATKEGLTPSGNDRYLVRNLRIDGQPVPDLEVEASPGVARLGVDGVLGFNFFTKFGEVRWKPATGEITLLAS